MTIDLISAEHQIHCVANFQELISTAFYRNTNVICWTRILLGDFEEIVNKIKLQENITVITTEDLLELPLSDAGQVARDIILQDMQLLSAEGAEPVLNLIKHYDRDDAYPFFPTDVYSFHVDRSPIPTDTFLCTYYGASSEIIANSQAEKKVLNSEICSELKKLYGGAEEGFESFLSEHFFDLHYKALANAKPISLGIGHLCKLAVEHPESQVLPCIHRAPLEKKGQYRLLLIC